MPEGDLKVICDDSAMIQDEKLWHWHKMAQDQPLESLELLECYAMLRIFRLCKDLAGARGAASHCDDFAGHFWQSFHKALRNDQRKVQRRLPGSGSSDRGKSGIQKYTVVN